MLLRTLASSRPQKRLIAKGKPIAAGILEMHAHRSKSGLTSPQACPSGVSAGQIIPHCVLCSWRGFASLPSRPIGELMRRRWLSVDA